MDAASHSIDTTTNCDIPPPQSYQQAISDPEYGYLWLKAIDDELLSLTSIGSWREEIAPPKTN